MLGIQVDLEGAGRAQQSFTAEEEEEFIRLSKTKNIYELLSNSIAPAISGDYTVGIVFSFLLMCRYQEGLVLPALWWYPTCPCRSNSTSWWYQHLVDGWSLHRQVPVLEVCRYCMSLALSLMLRSLLLVYIPLVRVLQQLVLRQVSSKTPEYAPTPCLYGLGRVLFGRWSHGPCGWWCRLYRWVR